MSIKTAIVNGVATIEIARPEKKNALTTAMYTAFAEAIRAADGDPGVRVMLIEGAERYGLSQLHQLRGRVGRGRHESHCILFADPESELARRRMEAIATIRDGFELAEVDLTLRGEGEILGTRQHGRLPDLLIADLVRDVRLLPVASQAALETVRKDPGLARDAALLRAVTKRWGPRLALANVG